MARLSPVKPEERSTARMKTGMTTLAILILVLGLAGCAVQREPVATITPSYSYVEAGVELREAPRGAAAFTRADPSRLPPLPAAPGFEGKSLLVEIGVK